VRTLEARVLLDRPLDIDRDPPLHRQRQQLAVVGGEGLSLSLGLHRGLLGS
jgi:hypothetical protein